MSILAEFLRETPIWVWVLLAYLVMKGIKARKPGNTTLAKMAIVPVLFTVWGLHDLTTLYGVSTGSTTLWLAGIAAGSLVGWNIVARMNLVPDRAAGTIYRPADFTMLPLLLVSFAIKYGFGVIAAVSPDLLHQTSFMIADHALSGFFTGIFIGKFSRYAWVWRSAPAIAA